MPGPFREGPLTRQQADHLNRVWAVAEKVRRLTAKPPLTFDLTAANPVVRLAPQDRPLLATVTAAAHPRYTVKRQTRTTADGIEDFAPLESIETVVSPFEMEAGDVCQVYPIVDWPGWWWAQPAGPGCDACPENLCGRYDAAGNLVGIEYTLNGIPRALTACPALPPPPPPVAGGTCPAIPVICVTVTGATADVTMTDGFLENFDTTGNPTAESRGTYYQNTANKCVYGRDPTQDLGASYTESDYAALMEAVGLDNPSPYGASDYGEYLPFGYDPGITTGTDDQLIPFVGARITPWYVPATRQWSLSVPKARGGGAVNPSFLSTPHEVGASPLPAVFPAQSITDQFDANNAIVYAITGARIEAGVCLGVLAPSMGAGLFPGTTAPAEFQLATTNPADTATLPMSPIAGGWTGSTSGGSLPVVFNAAVGPTISIGGVPIPLATGGSTPDVYTFTDGTTTAVVYR